MSTRLDFNILVFIQLATFFLKRAKEFKTQLNNNNIIQVHRSYLINLDFVYDVNSKFIILRNKKEINIGKTYKKKFKLTYQDYLLNGSL